MADTAQYNTYHPKEDEFHRAINLMDYSNLTERKLTCNTKLIYELKIGGRIGFDYSNLSVEVPKGLEGELIDELKIILEEENEDN